MSWEISVVNQEVILQLSVEEGTASEARVAAVAAATVATSQAGIATQKATDAETFATASATSAGQALGYKNESEAAKDLAVTAKDEAESFAQTVLAYPVAVVEGLVDQAILSKNQSATSATQSVDAKNLAVIAKNEAEQFSRNIVNVFPNAVRNQTWIQQSNVLITYSGLGMELAFSNNGSARFNNPFTVTSGKRYGVIVSYTLNSNTGSHFQISTFGNSTYVESGNWTENYIGVKTTKAFILNYSYTGTPIFYFQKYNSGACNITVHEIILVDLGLTGNKNYLITALSLKSFFDASGYFDRLTISDVAKSVENIDPSLIPVRSVWAGRKMVTLGHSIVYQNTWQTLLSELLGTTYTSSDTTTGLSSLPLALGGSTIRPFYTNSTAYSLGVDGANANGKKNSSIHHRAKSLPSYNAGLIIVMNAQNDPITATQVGTINDTSYTGNEVLATNSNDIIIPTLYSSLKGLLEIITSQNLSAKVVYVSILKNWKYNPALAITEDYFSSPNRKSVWQCEKDCCELYGVDFVDMFSDGWGAFNASYFMSNDSDNTTWQNNNLSRVHPNIYGGERMARTVFAKIS